MNYQGYITEGGAPLSGQHTLTFKLYNDADEGTLVWGPQVFDGTTGDGHGPKVLFAEGRFNVTLREDSEGDLLGTALAANSFPDGCWLEIRVDYNVPMPRQQLLSAPFAFMAATAADIRHDALSLTTTGVEVTGKVTATNGFAGFGVVPIGSVIAWHKSLSGVPALPDGWVECNGQTLSDVASPLNGQAIPDLNGQARFLRGGSTSGTTQSDAMQGHAHPPGTLNITASGSHSHQMDAYRIRNGDSGNSLFQAVMPPGYSTSDGAKATSSSVSHTHAADAFAGATGSPTSDGASGTPRTASETRPVNMSVVWVMRVK
jgi:hypothetical protein